MQISCQWIGCMRAGRPIWVHWGLQCGVSPQVPYQAVLQICQECKIQL